MDSISILGTGKMARALAGRAEASGYTVELIGREPRIPTGDIVIVAVPYASAAGVVAALDLRGKVLIDITNPISPDFKRLVAPEGSSGAEELAKASGAAHIVKAFNSVFADVLASGRRLDVFIAGDDADAKARVSAFIERLGLRPLDAGPLFMARALENVALLELGLVAHSVKHIDFSLAVQEH